MNYKNKEDHSQIENLKCMSSANNLEYNSHSDCSEVQDGIIYNAFSSNPDIDKIYNDELRSINSCSIKIVRRTEKEHEFESKRKEYADIEKETSQFRDIKLNKLKISTILNDPMVLKIRQDMVKERDCTYQDTDIDNIYQLNNQIYSGGDKGSMFKKRPYSIQNQQSSNSKSKGGNSFIKVKDILKMAHVPSIEFSMKSKSEENVMKPITLKSFGIGSQNKHLKFCKVKDPRMHL